MVGYLLGWKLIIARDPSARAYMDQALTPVGDDDDETLDLMTKTTGVREALDPSEEGGGADARRARLIGCRAAQRSAVARRAAALRFH